MSELDASSLFNVKDQVVLVTGGGRGVGEMVRPTSFFSTPPLSHHS